jgi:DNA-binding GntR family transcriptional regulator
MKKTLQKLDRIPLREQIASSIRDAILMAELAPGAKVPEQELADQLGVSRLPVREAIRILEQQGLLVTRPKNGTFVAKSTVAEVEDGIRVRAALEELAIQQAYQRLTVAQWDDMCNELAAILDAIRDAARQEKWAELTKLDLEIHTRMIDAAQNSMLSRFWRNLGLPLRFIALRRIQGRPTPEQWIASIGHHEDLIAALRRHNLDECRQVVRFHILRSIGG